MVVDRLPMIIMKLLMKAVNVNFEIADIFMQNRSKKSQYSTFNFNFNFKFQIIDSGNENGFLINSIIDKISEECLLFCDREGKFIICYLNYNHHCHIIKSVSYKVSDR